MRVLVVAPWVPHGIRKRAAGLIELLNEEHEVSVLATAWNRDEAATASMVPCARCRVIRLTRLSGAARALLAFLRPGASMQQAFASSPKIRRALIEELDAFRPDVVLFNVLRGSGYADVVAEANVVVDFDDVRSDYYAAMSRESRRLPKRVLGRLEYPRMLATERRLESVSDSVLVSSPLDVDRGDSGQRFLVRTPLRFEPASPRTPPAFNSPTAVFVGRLCYGANIEAARWIIEQLAPLVRANHPDLGFALVGERPAQGLRRLAARHAVDVIANVPSVAPYYAGAFASLVPVRMATGVQLKLIESAYYRVPIISTRLSARQAGVVEGVHCLVADNLEEWADALLAIARTPELRARLVAAAHDWVTSAYDRQTIRAALNASLQASGSN